MKNEDIFPQYDGNKFPKFIIEDGNLIIGKVTFHREMVCNKEDVIGGGWYTYDIDNEAFTFFDKSEEFGKAQYDDVRKCVMKNRVFTSPALSRNISERFDFFYRMDDGREVNLKERI